MATESRKRIRDHLRREARYNPTKSLTALTGQLTQEYEDRFLVELIQNAYDAHNPGTRDGRVHVRLDEAQPGGPILYVANTGNAFTEENFDALTNVAQSSKPPGEGIGNKGVGFRSVLQVCEFRRSTRARRGRQPVPRSTASASASPPTSRSARWSPTKLSTA